jgi:ABC-type branched-subunit amino acid transport system substrate-binding protein
MNEPHNPLSRTRAFANALRMTLVTLVAASAPSLNAQILIGQTAGFTGAVKAGVEETWMGARLHINEINAKGGIFGQKIEVIQKDDQFKPELAAANAKTLIEDDKVIALFLSRGTPHSEAMLPMIEKYGVPLIAPSTGAMLLQKPVKPLVFNVRSSYQFEAEKTIEQLNAMALNKIAIIHVDDTFGRDALAGYIKGFEANKIKPIYTNSFDRSKPNFDAIVASTKQLDPSAIVFAGSGTAVVDGIAALRKSGWQGVVSTLSNNASDGFIKSLGKNGAGVMVSQVFPNERLDIDPLIREINRANSKNIGNYLSPAMVEGYAAAKVLVAGLRAAGPKPSKEKLVKAMSTLKVDLGKLQIAYSDTNHGGVSFSELSIIGNDGKFKR